MLELEFFVCIFFNVRVNYKLNLYKFDEKKSV